MPPPRATQPFGSLAAAVELFRADGLAMTTGSDSVTAAVKNQVVGPENIGVGLIDLSSIGNGLLVVRVGAATGTTPVLNFLLDVQDAYGNWGEQPGTPTGIFGSAGLTAAGTFYGPLYSVSDGIAALVGRLRWTVTGTTPDFTGVSVNVYGR